jgi:hypothetical protein
MALVLFLRRVASEERPKMSAKEYNTSSIARTSLTGPDPRFALGLIIGLTAAATRILIPIFRLS